MTDDDYRTESRAWSDEQLLLTAEQAARVLHVGRTTLYGLIKDGQLRAVHIGRSCRLTRAELVRYVHRLGQPTPHAGHRTAATHRVRPRTTANQAELFDLDPIRPDTAQLSETGGSSPRADVDSAPPGARQDASLTGERRGAAWRDAIRS